MLLHLCCCCCCCYSAGGCCRYCCWCSGCRVLLQVLLLQVLLLLCSPAVYVTRCWLLTPLDLMYTRPQSRSRPTVWYCCFICCSLLLAAAHCSVSPVTPATAKTWRKTRARSTLLVTIADSGNCILRSDRPCSPAAAAAALGCAPWFTKCSGCRRSGMKTRGGASRPHWDLPACVFDDVMG